MKHTFTLIASLLILSSLSMAQNRSLFDLKNRHQTKAVHQSITPLAQKQLAQTQLPFALKSANINTQLTDITHYRWDGANWVESGKDEYDAQGRLTVMTVDNTRYLYAYETDGWTTIQTMQMRDNFSSPWVSYTILFTKDDAEGNTIWEEQQQNIGGGTMMIMWGNKTEITKTTVGNIETYQEIHSSYQFIAQAYVVSGGYKNETEKNGQGKIIRETYYSHNGTSFVIESNNGYIYDGSGKLTGMTNMYDDNGTTRYEKYDLFYNSGTAPDLAYYYESANGTDYTYKGRYKDLVWADWAGSLITMDIEPIAYIAQKVIDPLGDKTDNANYTNMEKMETTTLGSYQYRWLNSDWFLVGQNTTETTGGITTTIDMWINYSEELADFTGGDKYENIVNGNQTTDISYSYDVVLKTWIPTSKDVQVDLGGIYNYETTSYDWMDINEDGIFDWVKASYDKSSYTSTHIETSSITYRTDGEIEQSSDYKTDMDAYGNITYTFSDYKHREGGGPLISTVTESTYNNEYANGRLLTVTQQIKENNSLVFVNKQKNVYNYGIPSQTPTTAITGLDVYPTVITNSVTVKTGEPVQLLFANANGGIVKTLQVPTGIHEVPVADLPSGLYILTVKTNSSSTIFKLLKK
jgi:hypothetical protein